MRRTWTETIGLRASASRMMEIDDLRAAISIVFLSILTACASVRDVVPTNEAAPQSTTQIIGARGPLTVGQSKALLSRIATEPGDAGIVLGEKPGRDVEGLAQLDGHRRHRRGLAM